MFVCISAPDGMAIRHIVNTERTAVTTDTLDVDSTHEWYRLGKFSDFTFGLA